MGFSKVYGPVTISENAGNFDVSIDDTVAVGGGSLAGVVSATGSAKATVSGALLADAGLVWLEGKFPTFAAEITLVKVALDAELGKL